MAIGSPQWMYASGEAYTIDQSLRFNDADSADLSKTFASAGNQKTWTYSFWFKRGKNARGFFLSAHTSGSNTANITIQNSDKFQMYDYNGSYRYNLESNQLFRDHSAWYHFVVVLDTTQATEANRVKVYVNGSQITSWTTAVYPSQNTDLKINSAMAHSIGIRSDMSDYLDGYLSEVNFIDGQALTPADFGETGDYGEWKPIEYSGTYGTNGFYLPFKNDYTVEGFSTVTYKGTGQNGQYVGGAGFKPDLVWQKDRSSAYNHAIQDVIRGAGTDTHLASNTTSAEGEFPTYHNFQSFDNDGFTIGKTSNATNMQNHTGDNYVAWNWDMGADTPTGFSAVKYTGNGASQSISNFGFSPDLVWLKRRSGVQNNNIFDSVRGNTKLLSTNTTDAEGTVSSWLNSFDPDGFTLGSASNVSANGETNIAWGWDMGNTTATNTSGSISSQVRANTTYGQSIVSYTGTGATGTVGHGLNSTPEFVIIKRRDSADNWIVQRQTGNILTLQTTNAEGAASNFIQSWSNSTITLGDGSNTPDTAIGANSGNYIAYCFHSVTGYSKIGTYTGNGSSTGPTITTGFRPAFVMIKNSSNTGGWEIWDSTRNPLNPLTNTTQANLSNTELTSGRDIEFTDTGFQIKNTTSNSNGSGETYIYMAFAGGMDSISDYNDTGSIDSRVKANPTYGQSIVTWSGSGSTATIGHGLSSAPEAIIVKRRDASTNWPVWHTSISSGTDHFMDGLNLTGAKVTTASSFFTSTDPTSSVFSVGSGGGQTNSGNMLAYCFHSVTGYSKFGSYTGNGSNTGTIVTTGFRPAFLLIKNTEASSSWYLYDSVREPADSKGQPLYPNNSNGNTSYYERLKFTDTGFQLLHTDTDLNGNGTTYIYMAFADKREYAYWLDQSGNNNDWTSNNLTESDISVDSPTNNFATFQPETLGGNISFSEGNLQCTTYNADPGYLGGISTISMPNGKWYMEFQSNDSADGVMVGVTSNPDYCYANATSFSNLYGSYALAYYSYNGNKYTGGSGSSYGSDWKSNQVIGIAVDADNQTVQFYNNNVAQGSIDISGLGNEYWLFTGDGGGTVNEGLINFGQDSSFAGRKTAQGNQDGNDIGDFYYEPPSGFLALCTDNLPDVAVTPSEHFNTVLYSGNGGASSSQEISSVGFQPDFVWVKPRNSTNGHHVFDSVRTFGSAKSLSPNALQAEGAHDALYGYIGSTDADGFTANGGTSGAQYTNETGKNYVAWNWKANGSGSTDNSGDNNATVSANTDAKFSVVAYTGTGGEPKTVAHGLGVSPEMIIIKKRNNTANWVVWHKDLADNYAFEGLNTTGAAVSGGSPISKYVDAVSSTLVTLGDAGENNASGDTYIMYCWASVDGYSKVGSYTGNGNADGTFIYTGFRPAFVMIKPSSRTGNWMMANNKSSPSNVVDKVIFANDSAAEYTDPAADCKKDFLSNGFKIYTTDDNTNESGSTYIYIAFAETPFKYSNGR